MEKLSKYNNFLLEKEFKDIVNSLLLVLENNTYEWDLTDNSNNSDKLKAGDTVEWDIPNKPKKNIQDIIKTKLTNFKNYINQDDPEIDLNLNIKTIFDKVKNFISKLETKEEIKKYFWRLVDELKSLPYNIKKDLFVKISILIMGVSNMQIDELIPNREITNNQLLKDITIEVKKEVNKKTKKFYSKIKKGIEKFASFSKANDLISFAEGGYTDNRVDGGNYTGGPSRKAGYLIGTNHGIAAFTLINTDIKPTTDKEIQLLKKCYGDKYEEFCGNDILSFSEQWELDKKHIKPKDLLAKWKKIMINLDKETATKIYENEYWDPQGFSKIGNQSIANILYDACVNQGPSVARRVYINSMKNLGYTFDDVKSWTGAHNILTPIVNKMSKDQLENLHEEIKQERLKQYQKNADQDEIETFSKGWKNRLDKDINTFT